MGRGASNYIAITWSASLQDTPLLGDMGEFGGTGNSLKVGPRKQSGPATRSVSLLFGQICVRFRPLMVFVPHVYESNARSFCKARMG